MILMRFAMEHAGFWDDLVLQIRRKRSIVRHFFFLFIQDFDTHRLRSSVAEHELILTVERPIVVCAAGSFIEIGQRRATAS